ncbi:MAG TPA: ring-cleaving dioxygenase [Gemmatimonadales bacterium]|jgi:glyoxalase family protein|nr:ring-cleaving dioxygenase [Gemmatimonadales bacterium]
MTASILGLHHVTATVADAQDDLDFSLGALGLRLLKKTINFDNPSVYHFYYGSETGAPGTIWTTFPYKGWGVPVGAKGAGQITATGFSVPAGSLGFWTERLRRSSLEVEPLPPRFGEDRIGVRDASGLAFELVAGERDLRPPWSRGGVDPAAAVRGLASVSLLVRSPDATLELLTGLLGWHVVGEDEERIRVAVAGGAPGQVLDVIAAADAAPGVNGLGTVHHVAMAVSDGAEQRRLRQELIELGYRVTEVLDRNYFQSIYFREPGGVLFELATVQPGFTVDEPLDQLGNALKLPAWEEPNRERIEAALPRISTPP